MLGVFFNHKHMMDLTFNEWQAHIAWQLEADKNKINNEPKLQLNAKIIQKLSRIKSESLRGVSKDRVLLYSQRQD
jgi:hypothetical protein